MSQIDRRKVLAGGAAFALTAPNLALAAQRNALPPYIAQSEPATLTAINTKRPVVAMTFDDGPHPKLTPILLDILKKRKLKATFYVIGQSVVTWPDIVKRILDEGHEVGSHTWSHPFMSRLGDTSMLRQIDRTTEAIYKVTGKAPVTFRPPYGAFTVRQRKLLHKTRDMPTVLWSVDPLDWRRPGSSVVAQRIIHNSRPGSVILSHDIHSPTIRAMPAAFDGLIDRGFKFVTVSELLGWPSWHTRKFRVIGKNVGEEGSGLPKLQ